MNTETKDEFFRVSMSLKVWKICIISAASLGAALLPARAANFIVTTNADQGPGSLRAAIAMANVNGADDTITFAPALAGATITLKTGELEIDEAFKSLTISADGLPGGLILSGGRVTRVLDIFSDATVVLDSITIADGLDDYGSGILSEGDLTLRRCLLTRNVARHGSAGALYQYGAFLSIDRTTIADNICVGDSDASGAGAYLASASADIVGSTFSGNCAVAALGTAQGGALFQTGGGISIRYCTFIGNRAHGLSSYGGAMILGGLATASHSIFAGNEALFGPEIYSGVATFNSAGFNFLGVGANVRGFTNGVSGDRVGTAMRPLDPLLGPLQFNGGPVPTHSPMASSPLIDAAPDDGGAPETDQRGFQRIVDGNGSGTPRVDLGAVEAGPAIFVTSSSDDSDGLHLGGVSLREALANAKSPGTRILFDRALFPENRIELDPLKGPIAIRSRAVSLDASGLASPLILSGRGGMRLLDVTGTSAVSITGVRFVGGRAYVGGGVQCGPGASVSLVDCSILSCIASNGGGAIYNAGRLNLRDCLLLNNTTLRGLGGAIDNAPTGSAELFSTVIAGNVAGAGDGGGIYNAAGGKFSLTQSAVQHNSATGGGGGIYNAATNASAEMQLRYSTIVHNVSGAAGGGVANSNVLRTTHTIFAENRQGSIPDDFAGVAVSEGFNLLGTTAGASGFTGPGEVKNVDAHLSALNVASGILYAPNADSPAIDAGFNTSSSNPDNLTFCATLPSTDLTGLSRIARGSVITSLRVDIGAVELQAHRSFATNAIPWPIPGRIEAENFDNGGEGVAYADTNPQNVPGAYRADEGVDIESATDTEDGFDVISVSNGEWLKYTVEVQAAGRYTLLLRVAADVPSSTLRIEFDGVDKTGDIAISETGGTQDWITVARTGLTLSAGRHVMRVIGGQGAASLNWIEWRAEENQHGLTKLLYLNRGGAELSDFYPGPRGQAAFPSGPEAFGSGSGASGRVVQFETPSDIADEYGLVLTGFLAPSSSGYYSFYLCSDNEGELWLGSDESPTNSMKIAFEPTGNPARTWVDGSGRPAVEGRPSNVSAPIFLEAGKRYYVEGIMKESDESDNLAVTWQRSGEPPPVNGSSPIGNAWLQPFLWAEPIGASAASAPPPIPEIVPRFQSIRPLQSGAFAEFLVTGIAPGPVTYEWLLNNSPIGGTNFSGTNSPVLKISNPGPAQAGAYSVVIRGVSFTNTAAPAILGVQDIASPDSNPPTVASMTPPLLVVTNAAVTLSGTAFDSRGVLAVLVSGNGFTNSVALGTTNWSFDAALAAGTNRFFIHAVDAAGNASPVIVRAIVLADTNRLRVIVVGQGTVAPNLTNAALVVGRTYKITATPGAGFIFAGWSGGVSSPSNVLNFRMTSGLVLQANFIANPFAPLKGSYNGLFYQTNEILHENSGFITASVTDMGAFSGRLMLGGKAIPFSGRFNPDRSTQLRLARRGSLPLTLELRAPLDGTDKIVGGLTDGSWVAEVLADRAVFTSTSASPFAGRHTVTLAGNATNGAPEGDSYGVAPVSTLGKVAFTGMLADGTAISQAVPLARKGHWPFYAALYGGKGSIIGWLTFVTNSATESLGGWVSWTKPAAPSSKTYPNGFALQSWMAGSTYAPSATNRVLSFSNGIVQFTGGGLVSAPVVFNVDVTSANKVIDTNGTSFAMTITTANGLFSGSFVPPGTNTVLIFRGALLQQRDSGAGFFLNRKASGAVDFAPAPPP
ncbi:MAG: hypothetical protein QOF48_3333 [Verrucomicrobiota bacterium]|jgi:hypothetical protein